MKKKKHWAGVFAMLGVALLATAFFQKDGAIWGYIWGFFFVYLSGKIVPED
jgi:hypothetical protein